MLALAVSAHAQSPSVAAVRGTVFDSVANAPLRGAVVQAALIDSTGRSAPRVFSTTADDAGRYRIDSLPAGKFAIGFQHNSLSALGLESPLVAFQLAGTADMVIDLAIPGGATVRAVQCPGGQATDGMLAGLVLDASRGGTLVGATVAVSWVEMAVVGGTLRTVPRRIVSPVGDDGTYLACGIASGSALNVEVAMAGYRELIGEITVPDSGTLRRDFRLADTAGARGANAVGGRVTYANGDGVSSGRAAITALGMDVPIADGTFSIPGVPAGTWLLEARVIGYEPLAMLVDVVDGVPLQVPIKLGDKVQLLDAVNIVGQMSGSLKVLTEVAERGRTSFGTTFLPGNSWMQNALYPADVLRAARGFTYLSLDRVRARGCGHQSGKLIIYLDGNKFDGMEAINNMVQMRDILAIEAYPDMIGVPAKWRTSDACAVIAIWTKR